MEIYPAVDLYEGKVVRLERGDYEKRKVYSLEAGEAASEWADQGARWLHVVDLEGARSGEIKNWEALEKVVAEKRVSVQFGGGVRRESDIERLLDLGVARVVIGTRALDPVFLKEVTEKFSGKIALSLDVRGESVQIEGWLKEGGRSIFDLFNELKSLKVACLVVTDIERDGTLAGINVTKIGRFVEEAPHPVILSGGVTTLEDIRTLVDLKSPKLKGAIIGKALYEGKINLKEAIQVASGTGKK
jgi:phosphoribosylformimino-5-aminoimidazole carboxamide ribotide isomerase